MHHRQSQENPEDWDESVPCTSRKVLDPDRPVMVPRELVMNEQLSMSAKGVYLMIEAGVDLFELFKDSESEMRELIKAGYLELIYSPNGL